MTVWRPGMKAVCIDASFDNLRPGEREVKRGRVYTVRDVLSFGALIGLRFEEVQNPQIIHCGLLCGECAYAAIHFRPAVDKPTSIEIFQRMCWDIEQRERA